MGIYMDNPAALSQDQLNEFTRYIKENPGTLVELRNGAVLVPIYQCKTDDWEECFRCNTGAWRGTLVWNLNGLSITSSDYDMIKDR
jgi:hypothetical protein